MRSMTQIFACCVLLLCFHRGTGLRCRTEEHQTNDRFQIVMQRCRARLSQGSENSEANNRSDSGSEKDDSYDGSSSESAEQSYDKKLLIGRHTGTTDSSVMRNSGSSNNQDQRANSHQYQPTPMGSRPYPYGRVNNVTNSGSSVQTMSNRFSRNNNTLHDGVPNGMTRNSGQSFGMNVNLRHDQTCDVHCFFEELNLVDQKGYPEKSAVTKIMTQSIRDPELQDFIEEAVMDCFYLIDADKNKEQCKFSQNLLNCLASKGRERCEDWDIQ